MEKQKRKQAPSQITKKRIFRLLLALIILAIALWIVLAEVNKPRIWRSSLPDSMHALAESLMEAEADTQPGMPLIVAHPPKIGGSTALYLDMIAVQPASVGTSQLCVLAESSLYPIHSSIYVNGIRASLFGYLPLSEGNGFMRCVEGNLNTGLHLIEFRLRNSFFGKPVVSQQWAIEVE